MQKEYEKAKKILGVEGAVPLYKKEIYVYDAGAPCVREVFYELLPSGEVEFIEEVSEPGVDDYPLAYIEEEYYVNPDFT